MDERSRTPENTGGAPVDAMGLAGFDPSLHSPHDLIERASTTDDIARLLDGAASEALLKIPTGTDHELSKARQLGQAYKSFLASEPNPDFDEVYFYALAPMLASQLSDPEPDDLKEALEGLLMFVNMPDREHYRGKRLIDAIAICFDDEPSESEERPPTILHPNQIPPGTERMFRMTHDKSGHKVVGVTDSLRESQKNRIQAAFELGHNLNVGRVDHRNPQSIAMRQELIASTLTRLPKEVSDFLLADPESATVDSAGLEMIVKKYNLAINKDGSLGIRNLGTMLESHSFDGASFNTATDSNTRSLSRRVKRAVTILTR